MISVIDGNTSEVISRRNLSVRLPDVHGSVGGGGGGNEDNNIGHKSLASLDLDKAGVFANIDSVGDGADGGVSNSNLESPARTRSALLESWQNSQVSIDFSLGHYSQQSVDTITDRDVDDERGGDWVALSPMDSKPRMKSVEEEEGISQEDKDDSGAMPVEERWQMWKREAMQVSGEGVLPLAGESSRTIRPRGVSLVLAGASTMIQRPNGLTRNTEERIGRCEGRRTLTYREQSQRLQKVIAQTASQNCLGTFLLEG